MLIGKYNFKIDAKNRVVLPSKFRANLTDTIIATHGYDSGCINLYSKENFNKIFDSMFANINTEKMRHARRVFLSEAISIDVDSQGRIVLPEKIMSLFSKDKEITFLGQNDYVEIWNTNTLENYFQENKSFSEIWKEIAK